MSFFKISSVNNPKIKEVLALQQKSKVRKKLGLFVVEGIREVLLAAKHGYQIQTLFFEKKNENSCHEINCKNLIEVSKEVYQKIAYRESTEGFLAIVNQKHHLLSQLKLPQNPLILIMQSLEKPGNVGAILRTADAANFDAVIIADALSDLYNPNTIRSSVGGIFSNQIAVASSAEVLKFLDANNIKPFVATLQNANRYDAQDYKNPTAIVVGAESVGVSEIWRSSKISSIYIPMLGSVDSMNVSVAAAILMYEALRQRTLKA